MRPAARLGDGAWLASGVVELAEPGIGVGLQYPGISREVALRMLTSAIGRVVEQRRGWGWSGKRAVNAHIGRN
jgi:hypothetical protein